MTGPSPYHNSEIAGYDFGSAHAAKSPVSAEELLQLEQTLGWTAQDEQLLRKHATLFVANGGKMVDSWRAIIGRPLEGSGVSAMKDKQY
jgi:hypothetical protein